MAQAADVVGNKIPQILEHELDDATLEGQADEIAAEFRKTVENLGKDRPLSAQFRTELDGIEQKAKEYAESQGIKGKRAELYGLLYRQQVSMWHSITGMSPEYIAERFPVVLQNYNSGANETAEGTAAGKSQEAGTEESQVGRTLNQPPYNETGSFGKTIKQFFGVSGRTDAEIYADIHGKIRNPKVANNTRISLGYVPDIYVALGLIKDKDLKASKLTFRKAYGLITQAELIANKDLHNHNVPDDVIKKIGSLIADPLLIMDSKKHPGRIMAVVQDFVVDKKTNAVIPPIVIIISPSKRGHGYSFVPTAYDKNNLINLISWADSKKKIYYISDKKIALNRIAYGNKSQLPSMLHGLSQSTLLSNSIPSKEDIVKRFGLTGNNGTSLYQTAYAGSRTDYDRPALEAIGTGEGNQVHGWGLYYALNRDVAEGYRERSYSKYKRTYIQSLDQEFNELRANGKPFLEVYDVDVSRDLMETLLHKPYGVIEKELENRIKRWQDRLNDKEYQFKDYAKGKIEAYTKLKNDLHEYGTSLIKQDTGQVHEVDIPENPYLLDEQKTFGGQSDFVKSALAELAEKENIKIRGIKTYYEFFRKAEEILGKDAVSILKEIMQLEAEGDSLTKEQEDYLGTLWDKITETERKLGITAADFNPNDIYSVIGDNGRKIYHEIATALGSDKAASQLLEKYGIKGITYDGRRDGRCFVIFNPDDIRVIQKFYQDIAGAAQGGIDGSGPRGATTAWPGDPRLLIELFRSADDSTLPHELAHVFMLNLQRMRALDPDGRVGAMLNDLNEAVGEPAGEMPGTYSEAQQEKFARMFERYLAEGNAPNKKLKRIFVAFKEWLRDIYRTFKGWPELSPAAKRLFDKWLTFDDVANIPDTEALKEYGKKTAALKAVAEAAKESRDTEADGITVQDVKAVLNVTRMARPEEPEAQKAYNEALAIADEITESQAEAENILDSIEDMEYNGARQPDERDLALIDKAIADIQAIEDNPDIEIPGITDTEEGQPQEEAEEQPGSETADRPEAQTVQEEAKPRKVLPGTYVHKEEDGTYSLNGTYYVASYYRSGKIKERRGWEDVRESGIIAEGFRTREEAEDFASRLAEMQEPLPQSGGAKAERTGLPRRPKHSQTGQALLEGLGFRAVKTGRELTKKETDRLMNALYDGVHDLSEILNIPPESLSLNGTLTVKLGAPKTDIKPGQGAYYRAKDKTIIMDSEAGSGRFAAAWYAAFTDYMKSPEIRPEMAEAFRELEKAIHSRKRTAEEARKEYEAGLKEIKAAEKAAMDAIDSSDEAFALYGLADMVTSTDEYIDAYPEPLEDPVFEPEPRPYGVDNWIIDEATKKAGEKGARLINRLIEAHNWEVEYNKTDFGWEYSRFASDYSTAIGKTTEDTKEKDEPSEVMEEAAFASYIYNRLLERGGRNTFLTRPEGGKTFNVRRAVAERINTDAKQGEAGDPFAYPYPVGREREAIFRAFDNVFSTLKWETTEQGTRLYQRKRKQKPIMDLTNDYANFAAMTQEEREKNVRAKFDSIIGEKYPTNEKNLRVQIAPFGVNHILDPNVPLRKNQQIRLAVVIHNLKKIIEEAVKYGKEKPADLTHNTKKKVLEHKKNVVKYVYFKTQINITKTDENTGLRKTETYDVIITTERIKGQKQNLLDLYYIKVAKPIPTSQLSGVQPNGLNDTDSIQNDLDSGQTLHQSAKNNLPETIEIDGEKKSTRNSEGNFIADTEEGIRNFYKWFGNSKVVDENGKPLVVYHGTEEDFNTFDMSKGRSNMDIQGSFFSPWELDAKGYGRNVMPVYLSIKTPADEGTGYKALRKFQGQNYAGKKAKEYLESQGYDGVINNGEEYIVFKPNQIKSVENTGKFDPGNPNIFYQSSKEPAIFRREDYAWAFRKTGDNRYAISKINSVISSLMKELQKRRLTRRRRSG